MDHCAMEIDRGLFRSQPVLGALEKESVTVGHGYMTFGRLAKFPAMERYRKSMLDPTNKHISMPSNFNYS